MGAKLEACYKFVGDKGGLQFKMRLAVATGVPSTKAGETADTPDIIAKFKTAIKEITGEMPPV